MSTPTSITPPRSAQHPQNPERRQNVRVAVLSVLAFHVLLLGGLLIQGCNHQARKSEVANLEPTTQTPDLTTNAPPPVTSFSTIANTQPVFVPATPLPNPTVNVESPTPPQAAKDYTVAKGDSFSKIAKANHISINALATANPGANSKKLKVGQVLQLPLAPQTEAPSARAAAAPTQSTATENYDQVLYVIKTGDTLNKIAKAHGTTVKALRAANGLKTDTLIAGKKLKLPAPKTASAAPAEAPANHP